MEGKGDLPFVALIIYLYLKNTLTADKCFYHVTFKAKMYFKKFAV